MLTTFGIGPIKPQKPITMEEVKRMKLSYGEHKGKSLMGIPVDYLIWLQGEKLSQKENTSSYFMRCLDFAIRNQPKKR